MLDEGGNREEDEKGGGLTPWTAASLLVLDWELRQALGVRWPGATFYKLLLINE